MLKKIVSALLLLHLAFYLSWSGPVPFFKNFTPKEYDAMSQNWSLAQDINGFIYVGNNSCMLRYNGQSWDKLYPFPEESDAIVRSLYADQDSDRIYVGTYKEFGYVEYDGYGKIKYTSLSEKAGIEQSSDDEIWYITRIENQIFFIYFTAFYVYDLNSGEVWSHTAPTSSFYKWHDCLYLSSSMGETRVYSGKDKDYEQLKDFSSFSPIVKIFTSPSGQEICVSQHGLYRLDDEKPIRIDKLGESWGKANRAIQCKNGSIIVGFISEGVYAFDDNGDLLWFINTDNGLIDNTVLSLMEDTSGNVWVALDKGLAVIYSGNDRLMSLSSYNLGKTSASLIVDNILYVGSNQGLARLEISPETQSVKNVTRFFQHRQIWSLYEKDGAVFVGENGGMYVIQGNHVNFLSDAPGGTIPRSIVLPNGEEILIQGSFTKLYIYEKGKEWRLRNTVEGFMSPVSNLDIDYLGNIWVEHMYHGLYKIKLTEDFSRVESELFFPFTRRHICKMGGRMLFYDRDGFFYYDDLDGEIKPFDSLNNVLGEFSPFNNVLSVGNERYWIIRNNNAILIKYHDDKAIIMDRINFDDYNVSLTEKFETVLPLTYDSYLFGVDGGFLMHAENGPEFRDRNYRIRVSSIEAIEHDKVHNILLDSKRIVLANKSSIQFTLSCDRLANNTILKCRLENHDYSPNVLSGSPSILYQRLAKGSYRFVAWAENGVGEHLAEYSIPIYIKPSPFASVPAFIMYIVVFIFVLICAYRLVRRSMARQKMRLQKELDQEIVSIRNEQLEASLLVKSQELATYSLIEAERNNVLQKLREELTRMHYSEKHHSLSKADYDRLITIIKNGEFSEDNWSHFYKNFDLIHRSFFRTLEKAYPDLTPNDLRICAYLRMNMSTKELAEVMGITPKGAEAAKYRLRKKLGVSSEIPLNKFLLSIGDID